MSEPLSITTGVLALLGVCLKVGIELKKFRNEAAEVRTTVNAMLADVKTLRSVLATMEDTFEELDNEPPMTGHIATHWMNLNLSLGDAGVSLRKLEMLLVHVNRDVKLLDTARRQIRMKAAAQQIANQRQEVQAYRDCLQLSLQTVTFYHQIAVKNDTTKILGSSEAIHRDLTQLATNLDIKLNGLEVLFQGKQEQEGIDDVSRMRSCVQSAATVISTTSIMPVDDVNGEDSDSDNKSELQDWLRTQNSESTLQWVQTGELGASSANVSSVLPNGFAESIDALLNSSSSRTDLPPSLVGKSSPALTLAVPSTRRQSLFQSLPELGRSVSVASKESPPARTSKSSLNSPSNSSLDITPRSSQPTPKPKLGREEGTKRQSKHRPSRSLANLFRIGRKAEKVQLDVEDRVVKVTKPPSRPELRRKIVFVGDGACGKTCFIITATNTLFPEVYVPTVFENYVMDADADGKSVELAIWDTAGQEDYDRLRPLSYPDSSAICICFAIDSPPSLDNVQEKWISEVLHFNSGVPVLLLGFKSDLRNDPRTIGELLKEGFHPVTRSEAEDVRRKIGAYRYLESSAKNGEGISETIESIARVALTYRKKKDKRK